MEDPVEKLLKEAAQVLKATESPADVVPSSKNKESFLEKVAQRAASLKSSPVILSQYEMEAVVLHFLSENGMDGIDLIKLLESKRLQCKEPGEGVIYGILNRLEGKGLLEGRWRESSARMVKTYHLTSKGGDFLHKHSSILNPYQALLAAS